MANLRVETALSLGEQGHLPWCCKLVLTTPSSDFLLLLADVVDARCWSVGWAKRGPMSWCWAPMWHVPSILPPSIRSECCSPNITCMEWTLPRESAWAFALNNALVPVPQAEKSENKLSSNGPPSIFVDYWSVGRVSNSCLYQHQPLQILIALTRDVDLFLSNLLAPLEYDHFVFL